LSVGVIPGALDEATSTGPVPIEGDPQAAQRAFSIFGIGLDPAEGPS
jgi:hypothetical protein